MSYDPFKEPLDYKNSKNTVCSFVAVSDVKNFQFKHVMLTLTETENKRYDIMHTEQ